MDSRTIRPWDGGAADDVTMNSGTLGQSGSGHRDKEIKRDHGAMDNRTGALDNWTRGARKWEHKPRRQCTMEVWETGRVGQGAVGQWNIGQWDSGQVNNGHVDNVKLENGTMAQWEHGTIDDGTMDQ